MIIRVDESVVLEQPNDMQHFSVVAAPTSDVDEELRNSGWGCFDGTSAWIRVDAVRQALPVDEMPVGWEAQFSIMIDFASANGWLSNSGDLIRSHVDRSPAGEKK